MNWSSKSGETTASGLIIWTLFEALRLVKNTMKLENNFKPFNHRYMKLLHTHGLVPVMHCLIPGISA